MTFRLAGVLCLIGAAAACSHNSETAKDPSYESEPARASAEPTLTPASLDAERTARADTTPAPVTPLPSNDEAPADTRGPLIADTKGAGTNDFKNDAPKPDNTEVNERDRNAAAQTPLDQKENQTDLKITQQIRKAVMGDDTLSFTAKNVKIITASGKVTLRGPVKTDAERSSIEAAARRIAGVTQVDNQIEVKK